MFSVHGRSVFALLGLAVGVPSCSGEGDATDTDTAENRPDGCLWEKDELLSHVDAPTPGLTDCGVFLGQQPLENECFMNALDAGAAVEITINNCIDCMIHSTYVSAAAGKFHLYREADYYGDAVRVVRVDSCTDFTAGEGSGANCAGAESLYTCADPLPPSSGF